MRSTWRTGPWPAKKRLPGAPGWRTRSIWPSAWGWPGSSAATPSRLPVILDDVLVKFDPSRPANAARVILEFARDQQVLLFSCHPELVDIMAAVRRDPATGRPPVAGFAITDGVIMGSAPSHRGAPGVPLPQIGRAEMILGEPLKILPLMQPEAPQWSK